MRDHDGETITETITIGPFGAFFTNKNAEMNLAGHSHSAEITLEFETIGDGTSDEPIGFPSFHATAEQVLEVIAKTLERPIVGTNEVVARQLYRAFKG